MGGKSSEDMRPGMGWRPRSAQNMRPQADTRDSQERSEGLRPTSHFRSDTSRMVEKQAKLGTVCYVLIRFVFCFVYLRMEPTVEARYIVLLL